MRYLQGGIAAIAACAATLAAPAFAQADIGSEKAADLLHSDLPLFGGGAEEIHPQPFANEATGEFGCYSRIAFGDWALRTGDGEDAAIETWYAFANYGVFHCFALVSEADDREELGRADARPSFFVRIGSSGGDELWAAQIGARPGSDYLLLSRKAGDERIAQFTVLQRRCPKRNVRDAGNMSILITRYCAINSRAELRTLARRMATLEPLGTLTLAGAPD